MNDDEVLATLTLSPHACQSKLTFEILVATENGGSFIIAQGTIHTTSHTEYSEMFGKSTGLVYYVNLHGIYLTAGGEAGFASAELSIPSIRHNAFTGPAYSVPVTECGVPEEIYENCGTETTPATSFSINEDLYDVLTNYTPENKLKLYSTSGCITVIEAGTESSTLKGPLFCSTIRFNACTSDREAFLTTASGIVIDPILISYNESNPVREQCTQLTEEHSLCIKLTSGSIYLETWEYYWEVYANYYVVLRNSAGEDISIYGSVYHYSYFPLCGLWDCYLKSDDVDSYEESYISRLADELNAARTSWSSGSTTSWYWEFFTSDSSEGFFSSLESSITSWISSLVSSLFGTSDVSSAVSSFVSSVESAVSEKESEGFPYLAYLFLFGAAFACISANVVLVIVVAIVIYVKRTISAPSTYNAVSDTML